MTPYRQKPEQTVRFVTVHKVQGHTLAEMIRARLESEGIPVALSYQSVGRVLGITVDGLGEVRITVPEPLADRAREILANSC